MSALKPPLGLRPRWFVESERLVEVDEAIKRYEAAEWRVPEEWLVERDELLANIPRRPL